MNTSLRTSIALVAILALAGGCSVVESGLQAIGGSETVEDYPPPTGEVAIEAKFLRVGNFSGGLAGACVARTFTRTNLEVECGYIDRQGEWAIAPQWQDFSDFSDGLARVQVSEGVHEFITPEGEVAFRLKADEVSDFSEGVAWVRNVYDYWLIDTAGKRIQAPLQGVQMISGFHDGLALAARVTYYTYENDVLQVHEQDGKVGFINKQGDWAIEPRWRIAGRFSEGLAMVALADESFEVNSIGFINTSGEYAIKPDDRYVGGAEFSSGLAAVQLRENQSWVFVNRQGERILDAQFIVLSMQYQDPADAVYGFSSGLVGASKGFEIDGGTRLYTMEGEPAFPRTFYEVGRYQEGLARFSEESELNGIPIPLWGFIS